MGCTGCIQVIRISYYRFNLKSIIHWQRNSAYRTVYLNKSLQTLGSPLFTLFNFTLSFTLCHTQWSTKQIICLLAPPVSVLYGPIPQGFQWHQHLTNGTENVTRQLASTCCRICQNLLLTSVSCFTEDFLKGGKRQECHSGVVCTTVEYNKEAAPL